MPPGEKARGPPPRKDPCGFPLRSSGRARWLPLLVAGSAALRARALGGVQGPAGLAAPSFAGFAGKPKPTTKTTGTFLQTTSIRNSHSHSHSLRLGKDCRASRGLFVSIGGDAGSDGNNNSNGSSDNNSNGSSSNNNSNSNSSSSSSNRIVGGFSGARALGLRSATAALSRLREKLPGTRGTGGRTPKGAPQKDPPGGVRSLHGLSPGKATMAIASCLLVGAVAYRSERLFREASWSVLDALYFSCVCLSTVGYGDLCPSTPGGRLFAALFGLSGVLLWSSAIAAIGTRLVQLETEAAERVFRTQQTKETMAFYEANLPGHLRGKAEREQQQQQQQQPTSGNPRLPAGSGPPPRSHPTASSAAAASAASPPAGKKARKGLGRCLPLLGSLARPLLVILSGGLLLGRIEGWSPTDSVYFSLVTATTIGFGDFSPKTRAGRALSLALVPALLAAAGDLFAAIGTASIRARTQRLFRTGADRAAWLTEGRAKAMDENGDGRVSRAEYVLYVLGELGLVGEDEVAELGDQFDRFDVSGSGYLEREDLDAMRRLRAEGDGSRPTHHVR